MFGDFITSCMASMPQITVGGDVNITINGDGVLLVVILLVMIARTKR